MENNNVTLKVYAKSIEADGKKFLAYSTKFNGTYFKIKFRSDCLITPKTAGVYDITVNTFNCSVQNGGKYTNKNGEEKIGTPTLWIKVVDNCRKYTEEEINAENAEAVNALLYGNKDSIPTDEPLPF